MQISSPFIKLDSFLKAVNAVSSGGEAKIAIIGGDVTVNGIVELRRGRKLYPGDRVYFDGEEYPVVGHQMPYHPPDEQNTIMNR
jgi:ribosome-associated protein